MNRFTEVFSTQTLTHSGGTGIRLLLLFGAAVFILFALRRRSLLFHRLLGVGMFGLVALAVLFPDATTVIAHLLGVGRGTDMIFYFSFLLFSFLSMLAFQRIDAARRDITLLARQVAHMTARAPEDFPMKGEENDR